MGLISELITDSKLQLTEAKANEDAAQRNYEKLMNDSQARVFEVPFTALLKHGLPPPLATSGFIQCAVPSPLTSTSFLSPMMLAF